MSPTPQAANRAVFADFHFGVWRQSAVDFEQHAVVAAIAHDAGVDCGQTGLVLDQMETERQFGMCLIFAIGCANWARNSNSAGIPVAAGRRSRERPAA